MIKIMDYWINNRRIAVLLPLRLSGFLHNILTIKRCNTRNKSRSKSSSQDESVISVSTVEEKLQTLLCFNKNTTFLFSSII